MSFVELLRAILSNHLYVLFSIALLLHQGLRLRRVRKLRHSRSTVDKPIATSQPDGKQSQLLPGDHIGSILENAAHSSHGLKIYAQGPYRDCVTVTYRQLQHEAETNAVRLQMLPEWRAGQICLILLDQHYDNIRWFWSVVLAGGVPVICPQYTQENIGPSFAHLNQLLSSPICLTTQARMKGLLRGETGLHKYAIDDLHDHEVTSKGMYPVINATFASNDVAAIMLTSGSTGNSKAVPLTHHQLFISIFGKSQVFKPSLDSAVLNWVSMDHVAGLVEAHLRALRTNKDIVLVEAADVVSDPMIFLELLARHKITSSFAPNFLLSAIVNCAADEDPTSTCSDYDLSNLRYIASGGEACSMDVCCRLSSLLERYGAPPNVLVPGFGMTETCAGCIYNASCPESDLRGEYQYAAVGACVPGVQMRIRDMEEQSKLSEIRDRPVMTIGSLELRGPVVFSGYINNAKANAEAFTLDGWFKTGDLGFIDRNGHLVLTGRAKDTIRINGVESLPVDLERAISDARIPGVAPGYLVCFAWRPPGASTEQGCIIYQHSYDSHDQQARIKAQRRIADIFLMRTGARPHVLPLPAGVLQRSSLGKLSRAKIQAAFTSGDFAHEQSLNETMLRDQESRLVKPADSVEEALLNIVASALGIDPAQLGFETDFFDAGMTSVDLFKIRHRICQHFDLPELGLRDLIKHSTVRLLKEAISNSHSPKLSQYDPIVTLKAGGSRNPLWLVHPGVGEVLVFVGLAQHIHDRPVFALRARGFEEDHDVFGSIEEVVTVYTEAIKSRQPHGPYAIAGYSYGSMLAFEITKRLEAMGDSVPFLGCFNLPPHIKHRMRQLSLHKCLLHLSMFLGLISEQRCLSMQPETESQPFEAALDMLLSRCDQERLRDLALSRSMLSRWVYVAFSLQSMASDYEPSGTIDSMDVFFCDPLPEVARSKEEWRNGQLAQWSNFCRTPPRFHSVGGAHYTMLSSEHVRWFNRILQKALQASRV